MLYHSSKIKNLKVLEPHVSTHGKAYVYALRTLASSLIFGAKIDDFDFKISTNKNGSLEIYECYEGALQENYSGKTCSIYSFEDNGFESKTHWKTELVSEDYVQVINEEYVNDILQRLYREESLGNIIINRFSNTPEYKSFIAKHIADRLLRFRILEAEAIEPKLVKKYGKLIERMKEITSGDLLN